MAHEGESGSRFVVDLGEVKLPRLVEKQVEAEIQAAVLRALAESDFGRNQRARATIPIWDQFPGQTLGLWWGDPDNPPDIFGSGDGGPLVVEDHTIIMKAIMENPLQVIRYLPSEYKSSKTSRRPSGNEVLQAALEVNEIDSYVKARIRAVLDILPQIEEAQADLPQRLKQSVDDLQQRLANKTVEEQSRLLRDADLRSRYRGQGGVAEGMDVAARILEDGQDSIYSPEHSFYALLAEGQGLSRAAARDAISDIGTFDTIGATAGGAIGSAAGGVGAGPGAVAGGAGASVGAAIGHAVVAIWDAIF
jgi:hypothetical protein